MESSFDYPPTVDLLDYLVPGVLGQKGNLLKAVRLWAILRSLYSEKPMLLSTDAVGSFSNAQWRDSFLWPEQQQKTLKQWLFQDQPEINETLWRKAFVNRYGIERDRLSALLGDTPADEEPIPFQVDHRTLRNDFATLEKLGWLKASGTGSQRRYYKVSVLPTLPWIAAIAAESADEPALIHFIPNDLANVVEHFPQPINGIQRFILDTEYIISQAVSRQVEQLLQTLKEGWQQTPVPPVRLVYRSIRYYEAEFSILTYPVCIYYFQRAPYLFAFGQTPQHLDDGKPEHLSWYDYRLDRILSLQLLSWNDPSLPAEWQFKTSQGKSWAQSLAQSVASAPGLPKRFAEKTPEFVQQEVALAMGVEIHRPIAPLLLRFERYFYGNYIANTERAKLFTEMGFAQAEKRFRADPEISRQGLSLTKLFGDRPRHKSSVFCSAQHRLGDNNVVMRLRAWGPNVEVLLPLSLRQRMTDDMQETWRLYESDLNE
ncbi:TIGR03985 family CRISPR-associated protein [Thermoleptolyngbya sichuanensis XZ-Cy5]|uniref:TIGR03985 family CRISPR-associated protein n=1 Tax=Thermoleptolyngbya sichuanensis TaxID=2885951 RepID=UPI00240E7842|nr:TIGR03985 family CRISPR-associated protein [Thermoleptolyngbya sichuanensis]MDG2618055.1 TIGR03985 family CRISPR-associated protein [Thermoleptolyngbya sichuanensis XZ-Cy5]